MRAIALFTSALVVACGCAHPAPARTPRPVEVSAPAPATSPPAPTTTALARPADPSDSEPDPRSVTSVRVFFGYRSQDREVYGDDVHDHDDAVKRCFDRAFPLADRKPFDTITMKVVVANADADPQQATSGFMVPLSLSTSFPPRGTYPDLEACVKEAIGKAHAPPDVSDVDVFVTLSGTKSEGLLGHGAGAP